MVTFTVPADTIWNDYSTPGSPSSGRRDPIKSQIRTWAGTVEDALADIKAVFPTGSTIVAGVLVSQSNGYSNEASYGGGSTTINSQVRAWANSGGAFATATLGSDPFRPDAGSGVPNNLLFHFGKWLQEQTDADIKLFLHAIPDTDVLKWLTVANGGPNDSTNRYDSTTSTAAGTVLKTQTLVPAMFASAEMVATGKTAFDIIIIVKGENEQNYGTDYAEAKFNTLLDQLEAETWTTSDTIYLIVEMSQEENKYPSPIEAWRRIVRAKTRSNIALVSSYGLTTVGDGTHFDGASHVTLGTERLPAALKSLVAPQQAPGAYDGRNNLINVEAAGTSGSPNVVSVKSSNTVVQVLYNSGDCYVSVDPQYLGQGDSFTVLNFSAIYSTTFYPGAGSLFSADTWDKNNASFIIGPGEAYEFLKVGPAEDAAYMVRSAFRDFPFKYDLLNGAWNGSFEMGNKNWTLATGYTIERDNTNAQSGNWVVKLADTSTTARDLDSKNEIRCDPDDFVYVEGWNKTDAVMNLSALRARIPWLDKSHAELSDSGGTNNASASATYRRIAAWAKAPANTVFARARMRVQNGVPASGNGYAWFDNIRMRVFKKLDIFQDEWLIQAADRSFTGGTTALQKIFDTASAGAITLEVGFYEYFLMGRFTGLSGSSGDIGHGFLGTATATVELQSVGNKATTAAATAQATGITATTAVSITTATASNDAKFQVRGIVNVTAAGTIIPAIALGVAATPTLKALTYCTFKRLPTDSAGTLAMGAWS